MNKENWKIQFNHPTELGIGHIYDENSNEIATAFLADQRENKKSLEFMLMAVNNHDALVSALENMIKFADGIADDESLLCDARFIGAENILARCKQ